MLTAILYVLAGFCFLLSYIPLGGPSRWWGNLVPLGLLFLTAALMLSHVGDVLRA